jgi:acylphosphatase
MERATVIYRGYVQGVGFRFTTRHLAAGFQVGGHVRNLADGTVEVVAEGEASEIERFLNTIDDQMAGHIHSKQEKRSPLSAPASDFRILL